MAYTPANLSLVSGTVGGLGSQVWSYRSTDANTAVDAANYITDALQRGMRAGDIVIVTDTDASAGAFVSVHGVDSVSASGANLTNAYALTNAD